METRYFYELSNIMEEKLRKDYKFLVNVYPIKIIDEKNFYYDIEIFIRYDMKTNFKFIYNDVMNTIWNIKNLEKYIDENIIKICKIF